jgi:hypothetical protein
MGQVGNPKHESVCFSSTKLETRAEQVLPAWKKRSGAGRAGGDKWLKQCMHMRINEYKEF